MVCAKSMEMTGEIKPGWIEAFAADKKYLARDSQFNVNDLDGDGIKANVLGALPLLEAPIAMRPHYSEAWEAQVLEKNLLAEKEFEKETGKEIDDSISGGSAESADAALKLLNIIGQNKKKQDAPVFLPLRDDRVIVAQFVDGKETFHAIGTASKKAASTLG